jgi:hypothetical protein
MSQLETQTPAKVAVLELTPPEVLVPVTAEQTVGAVPLKPDVISTLDAQLEGFLKGLVNEDLQSDGFREKLDSAFSLGRKEIAEATTVTTAASQTNFVGETDTPAYKAISEMRVVFDKYNPAKQGDLFGSAEVMGIPIPAKIFGISVPGADRLVSYLRRYESASSHIESLSEQLETAKTAVQKGVSDLRTTEGKLWSALEKLEKVVYFITNLDSRLTQTIDTMRLTQAERARAMEQEVLYYVRQNLGDVQAAQALTITAYKACGELRKTGRETINGIDRMQTLGMAALSQGVFIAKSAGVQIKAQAMLAGGKKAVEDLIVANGIALKEHVKQTTDFANNPVLGIQALQKMFDDSDEAANIMEAFRANALSVQKANNEALAGLIAKQTARIRDDRKAAAVADGIAL